MLEIKATKNFSLQLLDIFAKPDVLWMLDFYSDSSESSEAIAHCIKSAIEKNNLSLSSVSSYSADNASVNYGKHSSVYQKLKLNN